MSSSPHTSYWTKPPPAPSFFLPVYTVCLLIYLVHSFFLKKKNLFLSLKKSFQPALLSNRCIEELQTKIRFSFSLHPPALCFTFWPPLPPLQQLVIPRQAGGALRFRPRFEISSLELHTHSITRIRSLCAPTISISIPSSSASLLYLPGRRSDNLLTTALLPGLLLIHLLILSESWNCRSLIHRGP